MWKIKTFPLEKFKVQALMGCTSMGLDETRGIQPNDQCSVQFSLSFRFHSVIFPLITENVDIIVPFIQTELDPDVDTGIKTLGCVNTRLLSYPSQSMFCQSWTMKSQMSKLRAATKLSMSTSNFTTFIKL